MNLEQIKFRAKVKWNGNHRFAGDWIYGNLIKMPKYKQYHDQRIEDEWVWAIQEYCPNNGLKYRYEAVEIDPETIGQFSGLKDKRKTETYMGDIVLAYIVSEKEERYEKLLCSHYDNIQDLAWECLDGSGGYHLGFVSCEDNCKYCNPLVEFEVIGNIHDNPELLK